MLAGVPPLALRWKSRSLVALAATALVLAPGCGSDGGTAPPQIASVAVDGPDTLRAGQTATATAIVRDVDGATVNGAAVDWRSNSPHIATVNESGLIRALLYGTARISASAGGHEGALNLTVMPPPEMTALVSVVPVHATLVAGDTITLEATPRSSAGVAIPAGRVQWGSSNEAVARVDALGKVTAVGPGRVSINAAYDGRTGTSEMVIVPAAASVTIQAAADTVHLRDSLQLSATVRDSTGGILTGRRVTWSSLTLRASVSASGLVRTAAEGDARIAAMVGDLADTVTLVVIGPRVARLYVNTSAMYIAVGDTASPIVRLFDAGGSEIQGRPITWSSADTTIAAVEGGLVTGRTPGRTKILVESEGHHASFDVLIEDVPATIVFLQDSLRIRVGESSAPPVELRDASGAVVRDYAVTYATGDDAIASITSAGLVRGVAAGRTEVIARVGAVADTMPLVVDDADPITFSFNSGGVSLVLGGRATQGVHVIGDYSYATGRTVRFRSSDSRILAVSPSSAVVDRVIWVELEGVGVGPAQLIAEVDGRIGRNDVLVNYVPLASLEIVSAPTILRPTQSAAATVLMKDVGGAARTYPVVWASLDPTVMSVDDTGTVTALSVGTAAIIARHDTLADTVWIDVQPDAAPVITGISPAVLVPDSAAVIRGRNFDPASTANSVTIAGVTVSVTAASDTELTVSLPMSGYPCRVTRPVRVTVTSGGLTGDTLHPLRAARQQPALALGESVILTGADALCNELAPGGDIYLITLALGENDARTDATIRVRGEAAAPASEAPPRSDIVASRPSPASVPAVASPDRGMRARWAHRHREARRMLPALVHRFGAPPPRSTPPPGVASVRDGPALSLENPALGEVIALRVPLFQASDYCTDYSTVHGRVVYVGSKTIVLEDVDAPLARTMDAMYRTMGSQYDSHMLAVVKTNFGDPLVRDAGLGQTGRVVLLFSRAINDYGFRGVLYSPCDMYPRSTLPASNEAPVLYGSVPQDAASGFGSIDTRENWRRLIRAPIVHQTAHLAMDAERIALGLGPPDLWLDEALASTAEELFMRAWSGTAWKTPATYAKTLYCEVRPTFPECLDRPYAIYDLFASLYFYAEERESRTPLGPTSPGDVTFTGSGWWFLRWAVDHYATNEGDFLKALVRTPRPGAAGLAALTGAPLSQMLADWGMTLLIPYVVPFPVARPQLFVRSWNWHDIFRGMEADFPDFQGYPAGPRVFAYGPFDTGPVNLPGGAVMYLELYERQTQNQLIAITGDGSLIPPTIGLEIIRAR